MLDAYQISQSSPSDGFRTSGTSPTLSGVFTALPDSLRSPAYAASSPIHHVDIRRYAIALTDGFKSSGSSPGRKNAFCVSGSSPTQLVPSRLCCTSVPRYSTQKFASLVAIQSVACAKFPAKVGVVEVRPETSATVHLARRTARQSKRVTI
jgi:hypothetical protein